MSDKSFHAATRGLGNEANYAKHHHVLLRRLLKTFCPEDRLLVFGINETIERCRGSKIAAHGIYRDSVESRESHFVKAGGLRWLSLSRSMKYEDVGPRP